MYLSQVKIDGNNRQKTKELTHLGAYHNWVEQSFPEEISSGIRTRKLWRIDKLKGDRYLLILSETKPDISKLESYGVPQSGKTKSYDAFLDRLADGMLARFRITLNPVMSVSSGKSSGKRGRVVPHVTVEQQLEFLKTKSLVNGFSLEDGEFIVTERHFEFLNRNNQKPLRISKVSYEGKLKIIDVEKFRESLINGIGKKKAYGCGLLTVIPGE